MLRHKIGAAVAVVAVCTLLGCDGVPITGIEPPTGEPKDTIPPQVTSVTPTDGAVDVPVTANIVVNFSESVDPATVNISTFKVMNGNEPVAGVAVSASPTATFTPKDSLEFSTTYTAVLSGVKDKAGNMLPGEYRWNFTTMEDPKRWILPGYWQVTDLTVDEQGRVYIAAYNRDTARTTLTVAFDSEGRRVWATEIGEGPQLPRYLAYGCGSLHVLRYESATVGEVVLDTYDRRNGRRERSIVFPDPGQGRGLAVKEDCTVLVTVVSTVASGSGFNFPEILYKVSQDGAVTELATIPIGSCGDVTGLAVSGDSIYVVGHDTERSCSGGLPYMFLSIYDSDGNQLDWVVYSRDSGWLAYPRVGISREQNLLYLVGNVGVSFAWQPWVIAQTLAGEFLWEAVLEVNGGPPDVDALRGIWVSSDGSLYTITARGYFFRSDSDDSKSWGVQIPIRPGIECVGGIATLGDTVFVAVSRDTNRASCSDARVELYDASDGSRIR